MIAYIMQQSIFYHTSILLFLLTIVQRRLAGIQVKSIGYHNIGNNIVSIAVSHHIVSSVSYCPSIKVQAYIKWLQIKEHAKSLSITINNHTSTDLSPCWNRVWVTRLIQSMDNLVVQKIISTGSDPLVYLDSRQSQHCHNNNIFCVNRIYKIHTIELWQIWALRQIWLLKENLCRTMFLRMPCPTTVCWAGIHRIFHYIGNSPLSGWLPRLGRTQDVLDRHERRWRRASWRCLGGSWISEDLFLGGGVPNRWCFVTSEAPETIPD